jgi:glutaredoxin
MLAWLRNLFRRRPRRDDLHFVLYTRAGCHLCELAWDLLQTAQLQHGFRLDVVDVDTDDDLARQYGQSVPVITVNGKVRFKGKINPVLLLRILDRRPSRPG